MKNLKQAKEVFSFITASQKIDSVLYENVFLPLHDLYNTIVDNVYTKSPLQFYAKREKNIIGAMVSRPLPYDNTNLHLQIFSIHKQYRKNGFANAMLCETVNLAMQNHFKKIRVDHINQSAGFFEKRNFKLFLEIFIPENLTSVVEEKIFDMNLNLTSIKSYNSLHIAKFEVEKYTRQILFAIKKISPELKAKFVFEKAI